ncbi:uncharacterized protein MAM_00179 [Metarhizium album ARSEF 1941]|uniref:Uncharacterized protein n=1 Tax=Metarhizium album (strain ARSEF 1941) TaxID=1081103 RepID=A0A0B2X5Y5_METAS|nr:uncharacterized protein MAM_00179 [Metarhizium album ARSEF 1941]KHO01178.1 hypothetical protein MAM_00179 [Metarhizium album ARSEF 1941]
MVDACRQRTISGEGGGGGGGGGGGEGVQGAPFTGCWGRGVLIGQGESFQADRELPK